MSEVSRRSTLQSVLTGFAAAAATIFTGEVFKRIKPIEEQAEEIAQAQGADAFHIVIKDATGVRERGYGSSRLRDFNVCVLTDAEKKIIDQHRYVQANDQLV